MNRIDPIEQIPDPDAVRAMITESVRRSDLLRSLLNVAVRKAAYDRPRPPAEPTATADAGKVVSRE
jgi:hypothetical protein